MRIDAFAPVRSIYSKGFIPKQSIKKLNIVGITNALSFVQRYRSDCLFEAHGIPNQELMRKFIEPCRTCS
jgi:hypothetical protein